MTDFPARNPFQNNVVAGPRERALVDVPEIHAAAFQACLRAVEQTRGAAQSSSLLIHGEPGSGKTHLLARLRSHLERHALGDLAAMANVVAVRLNTSPRRLWRHLRGQVAEDLREEFDGKPCLHWILGVRLYAEEPQPRRDGTRRFVERWLPWLQQPHKDEEGLRVFVERCVRSRDLAVVLLHLLSERHVHDAWAWLRGDSLPESVHERLQVAPDPAEDDEALEDRAREVVFALCRLAGQIPFVFCFDQIESLHEGAPGGGGLAAFARMAAELHDGVPNAVLVSTIQSGYLGYLGEVRQADRDRFLQREQALYPLDVPQGAALARSRLDAVPELAELRRGRTDLWPLPTDEVESYFRAGGCPPRRLLAACAALYDRARGVATPVPPPPALPTPPSPASPASPPLAAPAAAPPPDPVAFVADTWQRRFEEALIRETPDQADALVQDALAQAVRLADPEQPAAAGPERTASPPRPERDIEVVIERRGRRVGVSLCNQRNMTSLAAKLRRLAQRAKGGGPRAESLVLVRHPRLPISRGAKRAWEYERELRAAGARWCHPSPEAFAALAALRDLLADARAGDLACSGEAVPPATVEGWLRAHLPAPLRDLADEIAGDAPAAPPQEADPALRLALAEWLEERHLAALDEAAAALGRPAAALANCAAAHPAQFGLLDGPPTLLFRYVPGTTQLPEE